MLGWDFGLASGNSNQNCTNNGRLTGQSALILTSKVLF